MSPRHSSARAARPIYRSFGAPSAELNETYGRASGYSLIIEAIPNRSRKHFRTIRLAKAWASANAGGSHYAIYRETKLSKYITVGVGATCGEGESWRFDGICVPARPRPSTGRRAA